MINDCRKRELSSIDRQRKMYGNNIPDYAERNFKKEELEITKRYNNIISSVKSKLSKNQKYCINFVKPYAMSYRVTYSDAATYSRKQTAVGDVLIVIHGTGVIEDQRTTKTRGDAFFLKHRDKFIASAAGIGIYDDWDTKGDKVAK